MGVGICNKVGAEPSSICVRMRRRRTGSQDDMLYCKACFQPHTYTHEKPH